MTTTLAAARPRPTISIGWIVGQTTGVLRRRFFALALIAIAVVGLPQILAALLPPNLTFLGLVVGLPSLLFFGAAAQITYGELAGPTPVSALDALRKGGQRFLKLWLLSIISNIGRFLGYLLLIIPGVIMTVGWMPATAIAVVENLDATASLARAWSLTRGCRWSLAGLLGIFLGGTLLILVIVSAGLGVFVVAIGRGRLGPGTTLLTSAFVVVFVTLYYMVSSVGSTVVYVALRNAKEGPGTDIASVFD